MLLPQTAVPLQLVITHRSIDWALIAEAMQSKMITSNDFFIGGNFYVLQN
jgi:hypothetical protein